MIGSAIQDGTYVKFFNENGNQQNSIYTIGVLFGYSSEVIGIQEDKYINVYDSNGNKISNFYVGEGKGQAVVGSNINVREGQYLCTYDKNGSKLHENYVG
jgi:hypothetical protein